MKQLKSILDYYIRQNIKVVDVKVKGAADYGLHHYPLISTFYLDHIYFTPQLSKNERKKYPTQI